MFQPEAMTRLLIIASKQQIEPVISELYKLNVFHIDEFVEKGDEAFEGFKIGKPLKGADIASTSLVKIRSIASAFGISSDEIEPKAKASIAELKRRIEDELPALAEKVETLLARRTKLESTVKECEQKIEMLSPFTEFPGNLNLLSGYDSITTIAGYVKTPVMLSVPHEIWVNQLKSGQFIVLAVGNENLAVAERELLEFSLQKVPIPEESGNVNEAIQSYEQKIVTLKNEIDDLTSEMNEIKDKNEVFLLSSEELLSADVDQAEAPLLFATTDLTFSVTGWVPQSKVTKVYENLDKACGGRVYISELEVEDYNEQPPVEYENPNFAHPTELFMDIYSRPKYTEIDPSLLMAIVYPIMFGLILGDVGYGAVLLVMSFGLRSFVKGSEASNKLLDILRNCSISSIIFGIAFSEIFGFALPWHPLWLSRHINIGGAPSEVATQGAAAAAEHVSNIPELLVLSIWIGILHITLGRLWGARNAAKMDKGHHRILKIYSNLGWILLMWGIIVAIWSKFPIPMMPDFSGLPEISAGLNLASIAGIVMLILGLVFIARENVLDLMEVPTIISHVLSYTRLIAVGLSSVAIAMVTNYIAIDLIIGPQLKSLSIIGIVIIVAGLVVFLFGHVLNTALGIIGGGLHPLRLHYVEVFTKFYRGGGKKYTPFGIIRRLTEQN